jgi:ABC-2 type transport system ATP-binding protein
MLRSLAAEGRTVFVSSHLMTEMALTADHLIVVGQGRLIADASTAEVIAGSSLNSVLVRSPQSVRLAVLLRGEGAEVSEEPDGALRVTGAEPADIGDLAAAAAIALHELSPQQASLEAAFMELTHDAVDYRPEQVA